MRVQPHRAFGLRDLHQPQQLFPDDIAQFWVDVPMMDLPDTQEELARRPELLRGRLHRRPRQGPRKGAAGEPGPSAGPGRSAGTGSSPYRAGSRRNKCEGTGTYGVTGDRYVCLAPADDYSDCTVVFRNTPVAVIPAGTATCFPSLDCAPVLPDLFARDDDHGPYEVLPVTRSWGPWPGPPHPAQSGNGPLPGHAQLAGGQMLERADRSVSVRS
ncbi:hypothetical protein [Streptomyces sp. NPDC003719]